MLCDLFDCTFIVNLPERTDRRKQITRELASAGMSLTPGKLELFPAVRPKDAAGFPSPGVRGCFLSHLGIMTEARRRGLRRVLVIEDDLQISPLLTQNLSVVADILDRERWGLCYLGHVEPVGHEPPIHLIPFTGPLMTSHFYGVNETAIERLRSYLDAAQNRPAGHPNGGPMHLDGALTSFREANPDLVTLIAEPNLGWQRPSRSDIHSVWYQSVPVFRDVWGMGRGVRSLLKKIAQ